MDNCTPDTGYEPNVMEFTGTTELNNAASSDIYFQDSLDYTAPLSEPYIDDDELGKLLAVVVDRTGEPVEKRIAEERESSGAQSRTLLNEQRKTIIAEYYEKVSHHELLAARAEQDRRILQEELLRQQKDFREIHQQDLLKMKEVQKFQNSSFDEFTRQMFIEDQKIIMELSGRLQELQNEVNCMNDSKDFQDAESVRSGNSHVTSQPML